MQGFSFFGPIVGGSRTAATSRMEHFVIIVNGQRLPAVNYYHNELHLGSCSSPISASANKRELGKDRSITLHYFHPLTVRG